MGLITSTKKPKRRTFLEQHAQSARELQEESHEEAENEQDEDDHETGLDDEFENGQDELVGTGVLALVDFEEEVLSSLKQHGKELSSNHTYEPVPKDLLTRFREKYSEARA